jgi:hypothetical protein
MILDKLQFGTFMELEPDIMEITIKNGVELDRAKLSVVALGLCEKYKKKPYAILANRDNIFFQLYEAMEVYDNLSNLKGMANLVNDRSATKKIRLKNENGKKIRIFRDRQKAISWLKQTLDKA